MPNLSEAYRLLRLAELHLCAGRLDDAFQVARVANALLETTERGRE